MNGTTLWEDLTMRDPEDAVDEAYGAWLGGSGYADMRSYRDVFGDGWNAGREDEARNCPQEGRVVALKAENERLRRAVALLNSMILSGESHSETSRRAVREALA